MTKITFLNKKTFISELNKYAALYGSISCFGKEEKTSSNY